mmetsp:Transcript_13791/g.42930  ORF Transcript_13791/g.42930 Transcript_13791/m.42930 type:complete len:265 (-) Transcript_13791:18-812(-)
MTPRPGGHVQENRRGRGVQRANERAVRRASWRGSGEVRVVGRLERDACSLRDARTDETKNELTIPNVLHNAVPRHVHATNVHGPALLHAERAQALIAIDSDHFVVSANNPASWIAARLNCHTRLGAGHLPASVPVEELGERVPDLGPELRVVCIRLRRIFANLCPHLAATVPSDVVKNELHLRLVCHDRQLRIVPGTDFRGFVVRATNDVRGVEALRSPKTVALVSRRVVLPPERTEDVSRHSCDSKHRQEWCHTPEVGNHRHQ